MIIILYIIFALMFEEAFSTTQNKGKKEKTREVNIPVNFATVVNDFVTDLDATFPEYAFLWKRWSSPSESDLHELFSYFCSTYPERFFDILYQNEDIFDKKSDTGTNFLPNVDFRILYHCPGVSETTRNALWKYLQLILVTILNSVKDKDHFGDTANLFEGVDEKVLHEKLAETIDSIGDFFKNMSPEDESSDSTEPNAKQAEEASKLFEDMMNSLGEDNQTGEDAAGTTDIPKAEDIHEHLKGLFDGKIGTLAKELAEEISVEMKDMFETGEDVRTTQDLLKNMVKNPKKIMDLMKTISGKLTQKMKSGDISEEEIMKEASELFGKMKGIGGNKGMGQFNELFKSMAKSMGGAGINMGAIGKMEKKMAAKERMLSKLQHRQQMRGLSQPPTQPAAHTQTPNNAHLEATSIPNNYVFRVDETEQQEKSVKPMKTSVKTDPEVDLDALANEIDAIGTSTEKKANKKKKTKK